MTDKNTGGPAFPVFGVNCVRVDMDGSAEYEPQQISDGMTLRDYFAAKAMAGICGHRDTWGFLSSQAISKQAYDIADAMLKARQS